MIYIGIDVGKSHHEAGAIDEIGSHLGKSLRFTNTNDGFANLYDFINSKITEYESVVIGLEATGHYWLSLYSYLHDNSLDVVVINPLQSDSLRNFHIRQTKTDAVDSFLIAEVLRFGCYTPSQLADEDIIALRQLARFRMSLVDTCSMFKQQVIAILDQVFPEYETLFSNIFGVSSSEFLLKYGTPEQCEDASTKKLSNFLSKVSRGRFGIDKALQIKTTAKNSCGIKIANDSFALQIKLLIQQIQFTESQVEQLDLQIAEQLEKISPVILTIPGIGPSTAAIIVAEIGDISRFENPNKLVAFAGIDPTVKQSGSYAGTHNRLSKRGSPYLRRAIWMAAVVAARHAPILCAFYEKKRNEGKAHGTAIGAVARKLTYTIYAILKENRPYEVLQPNE